MKKVVFLVVFLFAVASLSSCKSKKGCGLTSSVETVSGIETQTA